MKPNSREVLIAAAKAISLEVGFGGLTFDAINVRTGLTRSGIVYHFPQRELLIEQTCRELASEWDAEVQHHLGKSFDESTALERVEAYLNAAAEPSMPGLLTLMTDPVAQSLDSNPWSAVRAKWLPSAPRPSTAGTDSADAATDLFLLRLVADGLLAYPVLAGRTLSPAERKRLLARTELLCGSAAAVRP